jgi:hypothetical protein
VIRFATSNLVNVVGLARRSDVSFDTRLALPRQWTNANAWICEFDGRKIERDRKVVLHVLTRCRHVLILVSAPAFSSMSGKTTSRKITRC